MKKLTALLTILLLLAGSVFAQAIFSEKTNSVIEPNNHSFLTEEYQGSEITITGLLSAKKNTFVLKENPDSKSVVTFNLEVKKWSLKRKLRKLDGKTVKLTGVLTDASRTWIKSMKVTKIE